MDIRDTRDGVVGYADTEIVNWSGYQMYQIERDYDQRQDQRLLWIEIIESVVDVGEFIESVVDLERVFCVE